MMNRPFAHRQCILTILALILILSSCNFPKHDLPTPTFVTQITDTATDTKQADGWFHIFYTDPSAQHAKNYEGGPDEILVAAIKQARLSVDVAAYSLNLWSVRDALIQDHRRGVVVRMVMESDNMDNQEVQEIKDAGIPVIGDQQEGLMHNKFVVLDRSEVWTGSMNFTVSGVYKDNNNLIRICSPKVAEDYITEFNEMFVHHLFGQDTIVNTPYPKLTINGTPLEVYFSPDDKVEARIVGLVQNAQESINFMAYSFTSNNIGDAIMRQAQAGIQVAGVMDDNQVASSQGTEYDPFMQAGIDVRLDGNQDGLMHHKVIIIDQKIVITGSYNFTASAEERNDENVVIIFSPEVAAKFMEEFQRIYGQAQQPQ
ncbi:MAG: phospholipase D-like domain-containing protein [Anaerolineales bacterium]|jgi:phosphatidylserine/phosphatidylglycerophosphate/cardiolipin synthase-like enzyme